MTALHWLVNNSELYKKSGTVVDHNWFQQVTESVRTQSDNFWKCQTERTIENVNTENEIQAQDKSNSAMEKDIVETNNYDSDHYSEIDANDHVVNVNILVDDANIENKYDQVFTFAPDEGQKISDNVNLAGRRCKKEAKKSQQLKLEIQNI